MSCSSVYTKGRKSLFGLFYLVNQICHLSTSCIVSINFALFISYLEKSRHPGNWLPSKTKQSGIKRRKIAQISPKSKEKIVKTSFVILVAFVIDFFFPDMIYNIYLYIYIISGKNFHNKGNQKMTNAVLTIFL